MNDIVRPYGRIDYIFLIVINLKYVFGGNPATL